MVPKPRQWWILCVLPLSCLLVCQSLGPKWWFFPICHLMLLLSRLGTKQRLGPIQDVLCIQNVAFQLLNPKIWRLNLQNLTLNTFQMKKMKRLRLLWCDLALNLNILRQVLLWKVRNGLFLRRQWILLKNLLEDCLRLEYNRNCFFGVHYLKFHTFCYGTLNFMSIDKE